MCVKKVLKGCVKNISVKKCDDPVLKTLVLKIQQISVKQISVKNTKTRC